MKLYGYWRSSASWRVRIGLGLKGLDYTVEPVHLVRDGGQQHGDAHRARNPMRQVPVLELEHDGETVELTQSLAILSYLDARWPDPSLIPADPLARARVWQLAEIVNSGIQPLQNLSVMQAIEALGGDKVAWSRAAIIRGLDAIEALTTDSPFLVGAQPSIADICLIPQLYNARRFKIALDAYPNTLRIEATCQELPAFMAAHPDRQPDAQL